MSTPKLSERLRELRASMEMGTSDIMPRTWTLLDDCIALAQVQGSSGQEGEGSGRSGAEPPSRDPALTGPNAQAPAAGQSPSPGNAKYECPCGMDLQGCAKEHEHNYCDRPTI